MNSIWNSYGDRRLNKHNRLLVRVVILTFLLVLTCNTFHHSVSAAVNTDPSGAKNTVAHSTQESYQILTWTIAAGDTLSTIFDRLKISQGVMYQILSADESFLALDVLSPGHLLTFTLDRETRNLISMELHVHAGKRVTYTRVEDNNFECKEITTPGEWKEELITGNINGSFYISARSAGLNDQEIGNITDLFCDQIQFCRDIHPGDRFQIVLRRQFVDGDFTGQSRTEGVRLFCGKRLYSAFLFDDGNYYDHNGESLARAFRRYPMSGSYRIVSPFNPARRHPITKRLAPHNGIDFTMPVGTPILAAGDGVVTRVQNHPFAGKYVEIKHGSRYNTRYLHLSRILVRHGQKVQRGARIALSGNTGNSTGPHLHFEMHVNGRPMNPLTARIPMASAVPDEKLDKFDQRVQQLVSIMEKPPLITVRKGGSP